MQFSLTSRQITCLFYTVMLLNCSVLGVFSSDNKKTTCCVGVTHVRVKGQVSQCAYVTKRGNCSEAYVLVMEDETQHCIAVNTKWIKRTLKALAMKGNPCEGTTRRLH